MRNIFLKISSLSSNEKILNEIATPYNEALKNSSYKEKVQYKSIKRPANKYLF